MAGSIEATMVAAEDPTWEIHGLRTFAPQLQERVSKLTSEITSFTYDSYDVYNILALDSR